MNGVLYAPWEALSGKSSYAIYGRQPGVTLRVRIATVNTAVGGQREKAAVLAAAPELLATLQALLDIYAPGQETPSVSAYAGRGSDREIKERWLAARAVIAKTIGAHP